MEFPSPLIPATLVRRYKRFLADVELADGTALTVHCPNTGAMTGCAEPGRPVWLSVSDSKTRKYPHTWELIETVAGMACVHSARANAVVAEAVEQRLIPELADYVQLRREVKYGEGSRADLVLERAQGRCVVEIKSVTLHLGEGVGAFPDAVSVRATRHLQELQREVEQGSQAMILFCVLHEGINSVRAASEIDPDYAEALQAARAAGVEILAWSAAVSPAGLVLQRPLPVVV